MSVEVSNDSAGVERPNEGDAVGAASGDPACGGVEAGERGAGGEGGEDGCGVAAPSEWVPAGAGDGRFVNRHPFPFRGSPVFVVEEGREIEDGVRLGF